MRKQLYLKQLTSELKGISKEKLAEKLAIITPGISHNSIEKLVQSAEEVAYFEGEKFGMEHFRKVLGRKNGKVPRRKVVSAEHLLRTARHEIGHTVAFRTW